MAVSRVKTWVTGEVLTASDLNAEFNNILTNGQDLGWPATKLKDLDGNEVVLDSDGDTSITADTDDLIDFRAQGQDLFKMDGTTASSVNGLTLKASAAGADVILTTHGSDTDIDLDIQTKGTGAILFNGSVVLANVVDDTTPQLGGQLDVNGQALGDGTLELLTFTETASAVNHVNLTNAATGNGPLISPAGDDADVDVLIKGKGTGLVKIGDGELSFPDADGSPNQVIETNGSGVLSFVTVTSITQASQAAIEAETNEDTYIPPDLLRHHPGVVKAWAKFGPDAVLDASFNIASIDDDGVADYGLNFTTAFSTADYGYTFGKEMSSLSQVWPVVDVLAAGAAEVGAYNSSNARDEAWVTLSFAFYGDQ